MIVAKWAVSILDKPLRKLVRMPWRLEDWSERAVWQGASIKVCPTLDRKPTTIRGGEKKRC